MTGMKELLVLRHAKSSWKHAGLDDHDRPLNKRGQRNAPRMGQLLRDEEYRNISTYVEQFRSGFFRDLETAGIEAGKEVLEMIERELEND